MTTVALERSSQQLKGKESRQTEPPARPRELTSRTIAALLAVVAATVYLESGLLNTDPLLFEGSSAVGMRGLLWALRVLVLFGGAVALLLMLPSTRQRLRRDVLGLAAFGLAGGLLVAYGAGSIYYHELSSRNTLTNFHPYLQFTPNLPSSTPAISRSIFFIGGSSTEWPDSNGKDWPALVEARLREAGQRDFTVFNAGRQFYTSQHALFNYLANLRRHRPSVVVIMHAINDLLQNADQSYYSIGEFRPDYGHFLGPVNDVAQRKGFLTSLATKVKAAWRYKPREVISDFNFAGLPAFKENLRLLTRSAREDGAVPVLMTEPHLYKEQMSEQEIGMLYMIRSTAGPTTRWSLERLYRGMEAYNQTIRDVAAEEGVQLIDLAAAIPKTVDYFRDEVHYQDRAFPFITEAVSRALLRTTLPALPNS